MVSFREDLGRSLDLTPDAGVAEILEGGFSHDITWSLHAYASLSAVIKPARILGTAVFEGLRFEEVVQVLANKLIEAQNWLRTVTLNEVLEKGEAYGEIP